MVHVNSIRYIPNYRTGKLAGVGVDILEKDKYEIVRINVSGFGDITPLHTVPHDDPSRSPQVVTLRYFLGIVTRARQVWEEAKIDPRG